MTTTIEHRAPDQSPSEVRTPHVSVATLMAFWLMSRSVRRRLNLESRGRAT